MSEDDFYTEAEICRFMKWTPNTMAKNRCLRKGHPPFVKIGRQVLFPKKEFAKWLATLPLQREIRAQ